jgi:prophage tail gpP-like protein
MSNIRLTVNGRKYEGWKSVSISRSMEAIAARFTLGIAERWPGQQTRLAIKPGDSCRLDIVSTGEPVLVGYVDKVAVSYSDSDHTVSIDGRDLAGDLVDCSAVNEPGEWRDRTLRQIVQEIAGPFGLTVRSLTGIPEKFARFRLEEGETAFEAIERACRARSVLPVCDPAGVITLVRATEGEYATENLQRGRNILEASGEYDHRDRFSVYTVKSQAAGFPDAEPETTLRVSANAQDRSIGRYRPLVLMAEHASTAGSAGGRAAWEANVRAARSRTVTVLKQGWFQNGSGRLWQPNQLVRLFDDWLDIDAVMLITAVGLSYDNRGHLASLTLRLPDAFKPEPPVAAEEASWVS